MKLWTDGTSLIEIHLLQKQRNGRLNPNSTLKLRIGDGAYRREEFFGKRTEY